MASLRLLTSNLLVDRADRDAVRTLIDETKPDVVAVQELGDDKAELLADLYPYGHLAPEADGFGLGIVAARPVTVDKLDMPERPGWAAALDPADWPDLPAVVDVVNLHLINPIERPWKHTQTDRRIQIGVAADYLAGRSGPSVVLGDMNSSPMWPEYRMLAELGDDAAETAGSARRTWSHFLWGPRLLRIDHAFVNRATAVATQTRRVRGTDHHALVVDIEV